MTQKIGIIGASGYSGEELVRLIAGHPHAQLACVSSRSLAGKKVADIMPRLRGRVDAQLAFSASEPDALAASDIDIFFLALPHGVAAEFARPLVAAGKKVLDLSADFRVQDVAVYEEFYGTKHPAPELLKDSAYVIPELAPKGWEKAKLIACPGCYPTSILTPLLPLLKSGIVSPRHIVINSASGVSGAGKKLDADYLYCERAESMKAYGLPKHRHLSEIEEQLGLAAGQKVVVQFNPHLAPMRRGIATTITVPAVKTGTQAVYDVWHQAYDAHPCVNVLDSKLRPDTGHVVGSTRVDISGIYDERTGNFVLTSAIDNLLKGAGGQAVQIMNLWCGWPETAGLL